MGLSLETIVLWVVPVVFAITLHEAAHGYVARMFGDRTAEMLGRITLNPLRHIDPVGTIVVPALLYFTAGPQYTFGWAKPVPVNFGNLRDPKRDMLWVAAAGPLSNLAMALFWAVMVKVGLSMPGSSFGLPLSLMGAAGVFFNIIIMVLNLVPLPPLDGGRIVVSLLPHRLAWRFARIEPYGFVILLVLLLTGALGYLLLPPISALMQLIAALFDVPASDLARLTSII